MNGTSLSIGIIVGIAIVVGGVYVVENGMAPSPNAVCSDEYGEQYSAQSVSINNNETATIVCGDGSSVQTKTINLKNIKIGSSPFGGST